MEFLEILPNNFGEKTFGWFEANLFHIFIEFFVTFGLFVHYLWIHHNIFW